MTVKIGHASISEKGTITGNAGDQTGKEVCTRSWYEHSKGWVTLECIVPGMAEFIAEAMEKACKNNDIGYDQYQNSTLWDNVKDKGFDPGKTTKKVETDCARLVRVCVQYAAKKVGLSIVIPDFYTVTEAAVLVNTGLFKKLTDSKYNTRDAYLRRGMIQITRVKGHTWVILENGKLAGEAPFSDKERTLGSRILKNGSKGNDVEELQNLLIQFGHDLGKWGVDGDFGDMTEMAVREFQKKNGLTVDGIVGKNTFAALLEAKKDDEPEGADFVEIVNGNCYARTAPNTNGAILGTAYRGDTYTYKGEKSENGWLKINYKNKDAWVSGRYSILKKG